MARVGAQATRSAGAIVLPSNAEIRKILADRVEALSGGEESGIGIVVGVVGPQGRKVIPYGHLSEGNRRSVNGDTVFEIGSVTKVFTALLLADMVRKGEVALSDPAAKYLPRGFKLPERSGRSITLLDLATHTSGLPFMPDGLPAFNGSSTERYSVAQLQQFVGGYELPREIGAEWDYSNLGYWVLGEALASRTGMDFEALLRTRIIGPLHLQSTAITVTPTLKAKLATGHNVVLQPASAFAAMPGYALMPAAGGLVSTANDLLTLLSVAMGYERSPLSSSMSMMLASRRPASNFEQALGWVVSGTGESQLVFHDGGTLGYVSSVAWDPQQRVGVVVLSNQVTDVGDIARHLLRPNVPLAKPTATRRTEIALDTSVLNSYAGRYEAPDEGTFIIAREGDFLTIQAPASWGLPKLRLRAESELDFFVAELPLRVSFQTSNDERVKGLLIYPPRGQKAISANRISSATSAP
jgi:CubicO group peptidase (beta-lactamase class C family)